MALIFRLILGIALVSCVERPHYENPDLDWQSFPQFYLVCPTPGGHCYVCPASRQHPQELTRGLQPGERWDVI